jgi:hypothetical protein
MALFTSIDTIVKSLLLKEGKPVHYYYQYLHFAVAGLKEISVTTIGKVNSVELTVSDYKAVQLPCDYVDWIKVGYKAGERIRPLIYDKGLNHLYNYDSSNQKIPYDTSNTLDGTIEDGYLSVEQSFYDTPDFGIRTDRLDYNFCVMKERGEIQLSADYPYETVILQYIDGGASGDAATEVEPLAQDAIEKYILWQKAVHSRISEGEKAQAERRYIRAIKMLRAQTSDLTRDEIVHAVRSGYGPIHW